MLSVLLFEKTFQHGNNLTKKCLIPGYACCRVPLISFFNAKTIKQHFVYLKTGGEVNHNYLPSKQDLKPVRSTIF